MNLFKFWDKYSERLRCSNILGKYSISNITYIFIVNVLKFHIKISNTQVSDKIAYANSADPDQRSSLIRVYTVCHSISIARNNCIKSKL